MRAAVRRERLRNLKVNRWLIAGVVGFAFAVVAAVLVVQAWAARGLDTRPWWHSDFNRGMAVGAGAVGLVWFAWEILRWLGQSADNERKGAEGEVSTGQQLAALRRHGWRVIHDLERPGFYNVDHVAIGPCGVLAIESKWTAKSWKIQEIKPGRPLLVGPPGNPIGNAKRGARWVRELLDGGGFTDIQVLPVLVIWGLGAPQLPDGRILIEGVEVLEGRRGRHWRRYLRRLDTRLDSETVREVADYLDDLSWNVSDRDAGTMP